MVRFRVYGLVRFLSHAETISVFQRACTRAGVNLKYSMGFNPRPKMSLPLPRTVAIESDDELLCIQLEDVVADESEICSYIKTSLARQLPEGIDLIDVSLTEIKTIQPKWAEYLFEIKPEFSNYNLKKQIDSVLENTSVIIQRTGPKPKKIDVRDFLETIWLDGTSIIVKCNITEGGSIRIDEIMQLLQLDHTMLMVPIKRTNVCWQNN